MRSLVRVERRGGRLVKKRFRVRFKWRDGTRTSNKEKRVLEFLDGKHPALVSKSSICGFGVNMQCCSKTVVVGATHSFEKFYQLIGRFRRFGQTREVDVHVITSDLEYGIFQNVKRKWATHDAMFNSMLEHTARVNRAALGETTRMSDEYKTGKTEGDGWTMHLGVCVDVVGGIDSGVDRLLRYSRRRSDSLFTYSNSAKRHGELL